MIAADRRTPSPPVHLSGCHDQRPTSQLTRCSEQLSVLLRAHQRNFSKALSATFCVIIHCFHTVAPIGERRIVMSVSFCVFVWSASMSSELHVRFSPNFSMHVTCGRGSVLLWGVVIRYVLPVIWIG